MKTIIFIAGICLLIGLVFATLKTDKSNTAGSVDNFENLTVNQEQSIEVPKKNIVVNTDDFIVNKGQSIGVPKESFESMRRRAKDAHFN